MIDLNTSSAETFADVIRWAVLHGYYAAESGSPGTTPSQLLETADCTGGLDHASALHAAYLIGRKQFDWTANRPSIQRAEEPHRVDGGGRAVQQHMVSPARIRPQAHTELYPKTQATARPAMAVPLNPSVQRPAPQRMTNIKAPWR